jgi:hypothetical protein
MRQAKFNCREQAMHSSRYPDGSISSASCRITGYPEVDFESPAKSGFEKTSVARFQYLYEKTANMRKIQKLRFG